MPGQRLEMDPWKGNNKKVIRCSHLITCKWSKGEEQNACFYLMKNDCISRHISTQNLVCINSLEVICCFQRTNQQGSINWKNKYCFTLKCTDWLICSYITPNSIRSKKTKKQKKQKMHKMQFNKFEKWIRSSFLTHHSRAVQGRSI